MSGRRRTRLGLLIAAALMATFPGGSNAGEVRRVIGTGFEHFGEIEIDPTTGYVWISGGEGSTTIEVFDESGERLEMIENEDGVGPMVLDGNDLYAYRPGADSIDVFDTKALELKDIIPIPRPTSGLPLLTKTGGRLWMATGPCDYEDGGEVTGIPVDDGPIVTIARAAPYCAGVASPNPRGDTLLTYGTLGNSWILRRWDVSTRPPTPVASRLIRHAAGEMTFSPDGSIVYMPTLVDNVRAYSAADLTPLWGHATTDGGAVAAGVSPDGQLVAAGLHSVNDDEAPDVNVIAAGGGRGRDATNLSGQYPVTVFPDGVAFGLDSSTLYVVADEEGAPPEPNGGEAGQTKLYRLEVRSPEPGTPAPLKISLTRKGPGKYAVRCYSNGILASRRVALKSTGWYAPRTVKSVVFDDNGRCSTTIQVKTAGSVYAEFSGAGGIAPSRSAPVAVTGRRIVIAELLGGSGKNFGRSKFRLYAPRATPVVWGTVQPLIPDRKLGFYVEQRVDGRWSPGDRAAFRMDERGEVFATLKRGKRKTAYRVRTEFRDATGRRIVSRWAYLKLGPHECPYVCRTAVGSRQPGSVRWSRERAQRP